MQSDYVFTLRSQRIELIHSQLNLCDIDISPGEFITLEGENGVGKSQFISYLKDINTGSFSFMDQFPLCPLIELSVDSLINELNLLKLSLNEFDSYLFDKLKISHLRKKIVANLSGGEQQRLKLYLCLRNQASLYILDEPMSGVDKKFRSVFVELISKFLNLQKSFILVEHRSEDFSSFPVRTFKMQALDDRSLKLDHLR